jgi:hypothetical protein
MTALKGSGLVIDVIELRLPIRMSRAFARLAVRL